MRGRRSDATGGSHEVWSEGFDPAPDDDFSAAPAASGSVSLCLACGGEPVRGECAHDEVATLEAPTDALRVAARRLASLTQERRAAERALRRLVESEVLRGGGTVEVTRPAPTPAPAPAPSPTPKSRRRRAAPASQGVLAFGDDGDAAEFPPR